MIGLYHVCLVSTLILITIYTYLDTNISTFLVILSFTFLCFLLLSFIPKYILVGIRLPALYGQCLINCFCSNCFYSLSESATSLSPCDLFLIHIFQEYMWVWRGVSNIFIVHSNCDIYTLTQIFSCGPHII